MDKLPTVTAAQFLILTKMRSCNGYNPVPGFLIRAWIPKMSGPSFYQLMSRMEKAKLVSGRYVKDGETQKRRRIYSVTRTGDAGIRTAIQFYREK